MIAKTVDRVVFIDWFRGEIAKAQQERSARPGVTASGELEWVVFERDTLLNLINRQMAKLGKPQVEMPAVMLIEDSAVGHFDYTRKLAIGAAELVLAD